MFLNMAKGRRWLAQQKFGEVEGPSAGLSSEASSSGHPSEQKTETQNVLCISPSGVLLLSVPLFKGMIRDQRG